MTEADETTEEAPRIRRFPADHPGLELALLNQWGEMRSSRPDGDERAWTERIASDAIAAAVDLTKMLEEWGCDGQIALGHPWGEPVRGKHSDVVRFRGGTSPIPWPGTELWVERGYAIRQKPRNHPEHLPRLQLTLLVWGEGCKETERLARARFREMELDAVLRQEGLPKPSRPKKVFPVVQWVPDPGGTPTEDDD